MKTTTLKKSTWLDVEEMETISENLRLLGEDELHEQLKEYLDIHKGSGTAGNFTGRGLYFAGAYVMNLHEVDTHNLINISNEYNLFA